MVDPGGSPLLVVRLFRKLDRGLFAIWAAACTLASARTFYGYMIKQTGGEWSAPLDDVFIHFDYARATAQGHPFEWTIGNGYSSGNTSLTYPFVLAAGWLAGFTGMDLMKWAALVACVSVFATLLVARRLLVEGPRDDWGRLSSYLLPPIFLGVGALDWSLWSGMEVAFFLATWALSLAAWLRLDRLRTPRAGWALGAAGGLMVATRPEAALTIAVFGVAAALAVARERDRRAGLRVLVRAGLPAATVLVLQAIANQAFTGEWSANGAIVKLALNNPYMSPAEKLADYVGNLRYASLRNLDYHFADIRGEITGDLVPDSWSPHNPLFYLSRTWWWAGVVPLAIATVPLLFARTRRIAIVVWAQIVLWVAFVSLNGQVRWQNERYVMPAVAWMLVMTALGASVMFRARAKTGGRGRALRPGIVWTCVVSALIVQTVGVLTRPPGPPHFRLSWTFAIVTGAAVFLSLTWLRSVRVVACVVLLLLAYDHQIPKMRDQKFFFGRAARNIRDQHVTLGRYLEELGPRRVLVGDAGAIIYASDRPGLDIIGLGGYRGMPFARAGVHGLPATLELIERIPDADKPDVLAIFPTWWGVLPIWFADEVLRRFPIEGNVICGDYEHVVYRADWRVLGTGAYMRWTPPRPEKIRAEIDVADLVSEQRNNYRFERPGNGWTEMRVLADPADARRDMFDGGRRIAIDRYESFDVRGLVLGKSAHVVVRTAQEDRTRVRVEVDGQEAGAIEMESVAGWEEHVFELPAALVRASMRVSLVNEGPGDFVDYHLWLTQ